MTHPTRIALFVATLVALTSSPSRGQVQAGGENPKKLVLVEMFTSQG